MNGRGCVSAGRALATLALLAILSAGGVTAGCATSPCDDLDDAAAEGGCATHDEDARAPACEGEAEAYARCWLENVVDVCSPTTAELVAVADCRGR